MNGCIVPGTNIAVDFWRIRDQPYTSLTFFLTHLHGDHIVGLTSSWSHPIYCTEVTACLLEKRYGLDPSVLRPLEVGESHVITTNAERQTTITVTVIDANHCPGATMFLFEGDFGKILHTGDFRYNPEMFLQSSPLSSHTGSIDVVYLDNTFCSSECVFPSRDEARIEILNIIRRHPEHNVVIGMRQLGKEELLLWLAQELKEWISVSGELFKVAEILRFPKVFKVQDSSCRIRTVPFPVVCKRNMQKWNANSPTIAILPTSIYTGIGGQPFVNQHDVFVVPYSDHSSYPELKEFVSTLKPASLVPIVSANAKGPFNVSLKARADMSVFDKYCRSEANQRSVLPGIKVNNYRAHAELDYQTKKPKLRKSRSNPHIKRSVQKGVHYESLELETTFQDRSGIAFFHSDRDKSLNLPNPESVPENTNVGIIHKVAEEDTVAENICPQVMAASSAVEIINHGKKHVEFAGSEGIDNCISAGSCVFEKKQTQYSASSVITDNRDSPDDYERTDTPESLGFDISETFPTCTEQDVQKQQMSQEFKEKCGTENKASTEERNLPEATASATSQENVVSAIVHNIALNCADLKLHPKEVKSEHEHDTDPDQSKASEQSKSASSEPLVSTVTESRVTVAADQTIDGRQKSKNVYETLAPCSQDLFQSQSILPSRDTDNTFSPSDVSVEITHDTLAKHETSTSEAGYIFSQFKNGETASAFNTDNTQLRNETNLMHNETHEPNIENFQEPPGEPDGCINQEDCGEISFLEEIESDKACERCIMSSAAPSNERSKHLYPSEPRVDLTKPLVVDDGTDSQQERRCAEGSRLNSSKDSTSVKTHEDILETDAIPALKQKLKKQNGDFSCKYGTKRKHSPEISSVNAGARKAQIAEFEQLDNLSACGKKRQRCYLSDGRSSSLGFPISFSVKPLSSLSPQEAKRKSMIDTIMCIQNYLNRHK